MSDGSPGRSAVQNKYPTVRRRRIRHRMWEEEGGRCHWCRREVAFEDTTLDHLVPKCRGGRWTQDNLVATCLPCNMQRAKKGHPLDFVPTHNNGRKWGKPKPRKVRASVYEMLYRGDEERASE